MSRQRFHPHGAKVGAPRGGFAPGRRKSPATFIGSGGKQAQIDYTFVSRRWKTTVQAVAVKWGSSCARFGHKYDHGALHARLRLRVAVDRKRKEPQLDRDWIKVPDNARKFDEAL